MKSEILLCLNDMEMISMESDLEMLYLLADAYEKASVILEHREDPELLSDFEVFQEGEILNKAIGNKYENIFFRIISFIPRLLIATGESIAKACSQENNDQLTNGIDAAENTMKNGTPEQKHNLVNYINHTSDGQVKMNEDGTIETPSFKVGLLGHLEFLKSSKDLMDRIRQEMDPNSATAYQQLADNIDNILNKRESFNADTTKLTFEALKQCGKDIATLAPVLTEIIGKVGKDLNKQIAEMEKNGSASAEDIQKQKDARNALSKIQKWSKLISHGNSIYQGITKVFGAFTKDINPFHKEMTDEEKIQATKQRRESAANQRDIEHFNHAETDNAETKSNRMKLNELKRELAEQEAKLANYNYNDTESAALRDRINQISSTISILENEIRLHDPSYESNATKQRNVFQNEIDTTTKTIEKLNHDKSIYETKLNNIPNDNNPVHKMQRKQLQSRIDKINSDITKNTNKRNDLTNRQSAVR